jgi:hypothetical protein
MQFPAIHINGSDPLDLLKQYTDAAEAVQAAIAALRKIEMNARDYYTITANPEACTDARRWKTNAMIALGKIDVDLVSTIMYIEEQPRTIRRKLHTNT